MRWVEGLVSSMDFNKLDVWLSNAFQALPTELACGVAPRDRVKGQQTVSRFFWNLNSVDWDEALLSGSSIKHPHFVTKIVLVSQKKNKDICISAYDVDLLVTTESRISRLEDNPRRCLVRDKLLRKKRDSFSTFIIISFTIKAIPIPVC